MQVPDKDHHILNPLKEFLTLVYFNKLECSEVSDNLRFGDNMLENSYLYVNDLLSLLPEPHYTDCVNFIKTHRELFETSKGSAIKHQAWPGGYKQHIEEVMNIAVVTYCALNDWRPLPFTLPDALLCLFLHDIEKVWKHVLKEEDKLNLDKDKFLKENFHLTEEHLNAIKYAHGEGEDYHPVNRVQTPLAAFVHHCDNTSARIWFDFPKERNL